jgi:hypothetical protein
MSELMQTFDVNDDFPPLFYVEFGRLVVVFGRLEYLIKLCIKDLLAEGFSEGMAMAESPIQISRIRDLAKQQAGEKLSQEQASAFSKLIDQAKPLSEFRNDTVHAFWTTDNGQPLRIRPKLVKGTKSVMATNSVDWSRSKPIPLSEFQRVRKKIESLYQDLAAERKTWSTST